MLGCMVSIHLALEEMALLFSKMVVQFYVSANTIPEFWSFCILPNILFSWALKILAILVKWYRIVVFILDFFF